MFYILKLNQKSYKEKLKQKVHLNKLLDKLLKNIYKKIKDKDKTYFLSNQISVAGRVVNKIDKLFLKHDEIIQIADKRE